MNMQTQWKQWAIGGVAALTLTAGTLWAVDSVSAASATAGWTDTVSQQVMERVGHGGRGGPGMSGRAMPGRGGLLKGEQPQYLADALGVTLDELQTAQETVRNTLIDQAVTDGTLTQEQADQRKAGERVRIPGLRLKEEAEQADGVDHAALLADALGITTEELDAAQATARAAALAAALADGTLTQEQVDRMTAQQALHEYVHEQYADARPEATMTELLQEAVTAGALTQEQADLLLSSGDRMGPGGRGDGYKGAGGRGDGRGHRGEGMRGPRSQDSTNQPEPLPNSETQGDETQGDETQGELTDSNV